MDLSSNYIVQVMRNILTSTNQTGTHITYVMTAHFTNVMTIVSLNSSELAQMSGLLFGNQVNNK
jgi:hypothetical protein